MAVNLAVSDSFAVGTALTENEAEERIGAICFKTGPPRLLGVELEWQVGVEDPAARVPVQRIRAVLTSMQRQGALPGQGLLTLEPGGQVELSTAPAAGLERCVDIAAMDMSALRTAFGSAGLKLTGHALDPVRSPRRVLDLPRYAAMEEYFDRHGPWGRVMMSSTASVQVCVDAGVEDSAPGGRGPAGYRYRWRLAHALGPVLVSAFANSPLRRGRATGWKCTRQLAWSRLDGRRTRAPEGAEPSQLVPRWAVLAADGRGGLRTDPRGLAPADPREAWARYALDAELLCLRQSDGCPWTAPAGLTFRAWLRGAGPRPPTVGDLDYHLSTLFPPARPRGHLELRMIDAQPGDNGWIVPLATVAALFDDPVAADAAMAATEPVWHQLVPEPRGTDPWLRAARCGPGDPVLARAARDCFAAAEAALTRAGTRPEIRAAVGDFADRYVHRNRCPADDMVEES